MSLSRIGFILVLIMIFPVFTAGAKDPETTKEKVSYSIGFDLGSGFKKQEIDIDLETMQKGIKDAMGEGKPALTMDQMREVLTSFQAEMREKQMAQMKKAAEENKKAGDAYLAENKKKKGVKTLPSGLQYKVITTGKGKKPGPEDTVLAHYTGTLIDGTEFDNSHKRGQPAEFPVGGVIAGWTEALQLMPVGSKWELYIPSELAYGDQGTRGGPIGPNSALIFEVELISIKEKEKE